MPEAVINGCLLKKEKNSRKIKTSLIERENQGSRCKVLFRVSNYFLGTVDRCGYVNFFVE